MLPATATDAGRTAAFASYNVLQDAGHALGSLFFGARVADAASDLAAARLARRIGLVNTMVFTHVPSSLLLVTVAFVPSFTSGSSLPSIPDGNPDRRGKGISNLGMSCAFET